MIILESLSNFIPFATIFTPSVTLCVITISSGWHFTNREIAFLVFFHNSLMKISDSGESGPISEYETRNCLIASMLVLGIIETDALFK